ncbi:hypothetical protein Kpho01_03550 [Kitasatospora phosalacinea]|uniref:Uncharacterized protein n=1 Tax=Kitasatospora phosalacinea TaxID=2065 RepID=A0A9W6PAW6_9ACTN|nr:hypothetical protein Kpho01_03550 [Kitasatospora phosalacinea]
MLAEALLLRSRSRTGTGSGGGIRGRARAPATARCAIGGYGLIRPGLYGLVGFDVDRAWVSPYATSCAAGLRASDGAGRARICRRPHGRQTDTGILSFAGVLSVGRFLACTAFGGSDQGPPRGITYDFMSVPEPFS